MNGKEMAPLYMYLKRNSTLFNASMARAFHIKENYSKFVLDRYGQVQHYYSGATEFAVIEADIKRLIQDEFDQKKFDALLNPPDNFV